MLRSVIKRPIPIVTHSWQLGISLRGRRCQITEYRAAIRIDRDEYASSIVFAKFGLDSIGQEFGYPLFKEGDQQYESKTMRYNFGTKKGYITDVMPASRAKGMLLLANEKDGRGYLEHGGW